MSLCPFFATKNYLLAYLFLQFRRDLNQTSNANQPIASRASIDEGEAVILYNRCRFAFRDIMVSIRDYVALSSKL